MEEAESEEGGQKQGEERENECCPESSSAGMESLVTLVSDLHTVPPGRISGPRSGMRQNRSLDRNTPDEIFYEPGF